MENLAAEYKLSLYKVLTRLNNSEKTKVELVQDTRNNKIYVKKTLTHYNIDVYNRIKELNISSIPKIYEVLQFNNTLIVIEEFINGKTLEEILEENKFFSDDMVIEYMISLCDFLNSIHSTNPPIIHRDIKPANIIISNDNVLKVIDYDASRFYKFKENTDTIILGTQGYAPPEQFGFTQTDSRSDIYSMGVLMNVLTTGKHPNECESNGSLKEIIKKCTKLLADHRYQSALELKKDLIRKSSKVIPSNINKNNNVIIKRKWYDEIPGFRTGTPWKEAIAILFYGFLVAGLFVQDENSEYTLSDNIIMVSLLLVIWLLCTNFLNIKSKLPIVNRESKSGNTIGCIVYSIILIFIAGMGMEFFE